MIFLFPKNMFYSYETSHLLLPIRTLKNHMPYQELWLNCGESIVRVSVIGLCSPSSSGIKQSYNGFKGKLRFLYKRKN